MIQEEYFPVSLGDNAAQVCGQIIVESLEGSYRVINHFTIGYRIIAGEIKMIHQHNSYEYMQPQESKVLKLDMNTTHFVRSLLLERRLGGGCPSAAGRRRFLSIQMRFCMCRASAGKRNLSVLTGSFPATALSGRSQRNCRNCFTRFAGAIW